MIVTAKFVMAQAVLLVLMATSIVEVFVMHVMLDTTKLDHLVQLYAVLA